MGGIVESDEFGYAGLLDSVLNSNAVPCRRPRPHRWNTLEPSYSVGLMRITLVQEAGHSIVPRPSPHLSW